MKWTAILPLFVSVGLCAPPDGETLYRRLCASCHGVQGEGVADEYDEALFGDRSVEALGRYIDKYMPQKHPEKCGPEEAAAIAKWMHGAFYSPEARARLKPARIELTRLTNEQFRQSVADLFGSFGPATKPFAGGGLKGQYFNAEKMEERKEKLAERTDATVAFDQAAFQAVPKLKQQAFSANWTGSLFAPDTGEYRFRLVTPNGARLFLNARRGGKGREEVPVIDGWVSRGDQEREEEGRCFLLGGRAYPLRLNYLSYEQKSSSLRFEWKPPSGTWEVVPAEVLSPAWAPPVAVVTTAFPPDDGSLGYERGTGVSREWHEAVVRAAVEAANLVMPETEAWAGVKQDDPERVAKLRKFCGTLAERAFRRPMDEKTLGKLLDPQFTGSDPEACVRRAIVLVLCSPRFLYPALEENQSGPPDGFTVASRLALTLWDSLPDESLRRAAGEGKLGSEAEVEAQARRMIEDARARHKVSGFFHHWLAIGEADKLTKDRQAYPGFDERLIADLRHSLERFVDDVVWSESSDYRQLLQADSLFVNQRMADYYGIEGPGGEGFAKVKLPPQQRAGVFTHPYLLTAFSYHKSSSPIHRGVFVTRNILGRFLKPPPMAIEFMDDRFDPSLTMREKVTQLTSKESCQGCHIVINPLGFSLENYDATGRWRIKDGDKPVDPVAEYTTTDGETVKLSGPRDLADLAARTPEASESFVRQLFQHEVKQSPAAYGNGCLKGLHNGFVSSGYKIRDLVLRIGLNAAMHPSPSATDSR